MSCDAVTSSRATQLASTHGRWTFESQLACRVRRVGQRRMRDHEARISAPRRGAIATTWFTPAKVTEIGHKFCMVYSVVCPCAKPQGARPLRHRGRTGYCARCGRVTFIFRRKTLVLALVPIKYSTRSMFGLEPPSQHTRATTPHRQRPSTPQPRATCTCRGHIPMPKPPPTRRVHTSPARATPRPAASRGRFTSRARRAPRPPARSAGRRRSPPTECPGPGLHAWQQPASPHAPAPSPVWPACVQCTARGVGGGVRTRVPRPPPADAAWTGG